MNMRSRTTILLFWLALPSLVAAPAFGGKQKMDVQIKVNEGIGKTPPADSLSRNGSSYGAALQSATIYYLNVTVTSENADAVSKNNGQWCLKGDALLGSLTYHGTLSGNDLELEIPQPNGKIKKMTFVVYDHKWRKLADI
jgi:hypothetical protein